MSSKDTIRGVHRHISEEEEIKRIIEYYKSNLSIDVNKLEASAVLGARSKDAFWSDKKAKEFIAHMRGIL